MGREERGRSGVENGVRKFAKYDMSGKEWEGVGNGVGGWWMTFARRVKFDCLHILFGQFFPSQCQFTVFTIL